MKARIKKISKYTPSIFQGKFDFSTRQRGISLSTEHPFERIATHILSLTLIMLVGGYLYFVSSSVLNVIARKEALAQVTKIQSVIGGLEQQYFTLSQGVSSETGVILGLTPVQNTHYVYRPGNVGAATIARNAI